MVAHRDKSALATQNAACSPATVQVENSLLAFLQNLLKLALQATAENAGVASMQFIPQINYFDRRQVNANAMVQLD